MQFLCHIPLDGSIYLDYNQYSSYLNQEVTFSVTFTSDGCMETDIAVENLTLTEYPDLHTWVIALHHDSQIFVGWLVPWHVVVHAPDSHALSSFIIVLR